MFERLVRTAEPDGSTEAKQARQKGGPKEIAGQAELFAAAEPARRGVRSAGNAWDVLMLNARRQAEGTPARFPSMAGRCSSWCATWAT